MHLRKKFRMIVALILVSCAHDRSHSADSIVERIEHIDTTVRDSGEATESRVRDLVSVTVDDISDIQVLKQVILISNSKRRTYYQDRESAVINPFALAVLYGLSRLSDIGSEESAAVLVEFLENQDTRWGGELGLMHSLAITKCGRTALPFLRRVRGHRAEEAKTLIELIEAGKLYE